ncbi:MAG: GNAT family N-acetyltransferase [Burkholderiales bacterium]|nr:GNAT family N-acetyltransferase [Burkholderiales bacterium]
MTYVFELLNKSHDRKQFDCGKPELDRYIRTQVNQDIRVNATTAFMMVSPDSPRVLGFYTLSASAIMLGDVPEAIAKKIARYPAIPATLIGRLARDVSLKGQKVGPSILIDALLRSYQTSLEAVGAQAVVVDAKDEQAKHFYEQFGFTAFPSVPMKLFITMREIKDALTSAGILP